MQHDVTPVGQVPIVAAAFPWGSSYKMYYAPHGYTVLQMLESMLVQMKCPYPLHMLNVYVQIGDTYIPRAYWYRTRPKTNATLTVKIVPFGGGGKKNPLATILSIAVIAAAAFAGPAVAGFLGGGTLGSVGGAIASGLITGIGNLLVAAIAPPPKQRLNGASGNAAESPTLFIEGARNSLNPFGVVPIILGRHKHVPPLGAGTFTETVADKQYVRQLFCWGMGKYQMEEFRIGDTLASQFEEITVVHHLNAEGKNATLTIYPNTVGEEGMNVQLTFANGWQTRTTDPNANEFSVDISLPKGLFGYNADGKKVTREVQIQIRYAPTGTTDWVETTTHTFSAAKSAVLRKEFPFNVAEGTYDVQVRRVTADTVSDRVFDETWWTALRTVTHENPINIVGVSFSEFKALATDQLNGSVDQANAILTSICLSWDPDTSAWIGAPTNNPADLFRYVLQNAEWFTDPVNAPNVKPISDDRLDLEKVQEWAEYCIDQGFEYNAVIDFETNVQEVLREICSAGRASLNMVDGKWSVVIDREQAVVVQHFTAANSWGFQGQITYPEIPHALRISFLNEDNGYIQDERLVYDDGYSELGEESETGTVAATVIQGLDLPGITNPDLIWKHGREYLAMMRLRPREISFYADVEHLAATRGSLIKFAHPVPLIGGAQGYITEVLFDEGDPETVVGVILDRDVEMSANETYKLRWRAQSTNVSYIEIVDTFSGDSSQITFTTPFLFVDSPIKEGDLFMFGIANFESIDLIIRDIIPDNDLTAKITCLDAAPAIFTASTGSIPPFESGISVPIALQRPLEPIVVGIQTGASVQIRNIDDSISTRMIITLRNRNPYSVYPVIKIKPSDADTYEYAQIVSVTEDAVTIEGLQEGTRYDLIIYYRKVLNSDMTGIGGNTYSPKVTRNNVLFEGVNDNPPDITNPVTQIIGDILVLTWDAVTVIDFDYYEIRYSPNIIGTAWYTAAVVKNGLIFNETTLPAQTGTYLIKAFDKGGRESVNATPISITVVNEGFNAVETITENDTYLGTHDNTLINGGKLELNVITLTTGTYYFANHIDLGEIFACRLIPHIVAAGRNGAHTLSNWPSLKDLKSLAGEDPSTWTVTIYERHSNTGINELLDDNGEEILDDNSAVLLDDDGVTIWTSWAPVTLGMYNGRTFEFKAIITGNGINVTPSIEELAVIIDMEDRIEKGDNVVVLAAGTTITFDPPYRIKPSTTLTIIDQIEGDVVTISAETETGFTVTVTNGGIGVERHMNYHTVGYGRRLT